MWVQCLIFWAWFDPALGPNPFRNRRFSRRILKRFLGPSAGPSGACRSGKAAHFVVVFFFAPLFWRCSVVLGHSGSRALPGIRVLLRDPNRDPRAPLGSLGRALPVPHVSKLQPKPLPVLATTSLIPNGTSARWLIGIRFSVSKPYEIVGFGAIYVTKPYEFIRLGPYMSPNLMNL